MKGLTVAAAAAVLLALGLAACEKDEKRKEVIKEVVDFNAKCQANPQLPECVKDKEQKSGG